MPEDAYRDKSPAEVAEDLRAWQIRFPEGSKAEYRVRNYTDEDLIAPQRSYWPECFCLLCFRPLKFCDCRGAGSRETVPYIGDLRPQPPCMTHEDHYFRLDSVLSNMYLACLGDTAKFFGDWGGFLTAALTMNRASLLKAADTYSRKIDLDTLACQVKSDLVYPLAMLDILDTDPTDKVAVGTYIRDAAAMFVQGNFSQMCFFDLWFSREIVKASEIPADHKEIIDIVVMNLGLLAYWSISRYPVLPPDYSKRRRLMQSAPIFDRIAP